MFACYVLLLGQRIQLVMTIVEAELKLMLPHNLSHIVIDDVKGERSPLRILGFEIPVVHTSQVIHRRPARLVEWIRQPKLVGILHSWLAGTGKPCLRRPADQHFIEQCWRERVHPGTRRRLVRRTPVHGTSNIIQRSEAVELRKQIVRPLRITPVEQVRVRESVIDACGYRPIPPPVRLRAIEIRGYQRVNVRQSRQWRDAEQIFGQRALTSRIDHVQQTLVGDLPPLPRLGVSGPGVIDYVRNAVCVH